MTSEGVGLVERLEQRLTKQLGTTGDVSLQVMVGIDHAEHEPEIIQLVEKLKDTGLNLWESSVRVLGMVRGVSDGLVANGSVTVWTPGPGQSKRLQVEHFTIDVWWARGLDAGQLDIYQTLREDRVGRGWALLAAKECST